MRKPLCISLCLFFVGSLRFASAQNATDSPYSRYGIGDLSSITFARNLGLGGTEIGLNLPYSINCGNPAANAGLALTTYEAGTDFKQSEFKNNSTIHQTNTASLSYFEFGFPIKPQKWALGFGLLPYSKVGYAVTDKKISEFNDIEVKRYQGSGGLNNFHISTGFKVSKKVSLGLNAEYLFGVINNIRTLYFVNPNYMNVELDKSASIGWFHFKGGLQYKVDSLPWGKSDSLIQSEKRLKILEESLKIEINKKDSTANGYEMKNKLAQDIAKEELLKNSIINKKVKSDWNLVYGLVVTPAINLHARNTTLVRSFRYFQFGAPSSGTIVKDTVENTEGEKGKVLLPFGAGFGFSLSKGTRWIFCADYSIQQWSDFTFLGAEDSLQNSWRVSAGIQFTPDDRAIKSYWKTIQYRVGFRYDNGYIKLNDTRITEIGLSAGFAMPIRKAGTLIHFAVEGGNRGTTKNNLVLERYIKFTLGFTINDRWFVKSKYD